MTDADNADDLALLANTPAQCKSLLHSLLQAAESIVSYVNAKKKKEPSVLNTKEPSLL